MFLVKCIPLQKYKNCLPFVRVSILSINPLTNTSFIKVLLRNIFKVSTYIAKPKSRVQAENQLNLFRKNAYRLSGVGQLYDMKVQVTMPFCRSRASLAFGKKTIKICRFVSYLYRDKYF